MCNKSHALEGLHVCARLHVQLYVSHDKAWSLKILPGIRSSEASSKAIWEVKIIFGLNGVIINVNSFHATGLFWYPPENRKPKVFWCFQGASKESSAMKWVNVVSGQNENDYLK